MCGKSKPAYKKTRKIRNLLFKKQTNKTKPTNKQTKTPTTSGASCIDALPAVNLEKSESPNSLLACNSCLAALG